MPESKSKDELVDSHVSERQCRLAIEALRIHVLEKERERDDKELLPGKVQHIWLIVSVKKIYPRHKIKPFKIPVVHPLVDPRTMSVCLITKDPQREYKDMLESQKIKFISRVVGITKLKGKFKPFEARRLLLKENDMFLADERVIPVLPPLLGKKWFEAKKQPIPVCLTRKDLKGELERAISSTYMHQNQGTCTAVKISTISHTPSQILANLKSALPSIVKNIKGEWENIQSIHIKTNSSASLPIWTCSLDDSEEGRWGGSAAVVNKEATEESDDGNESAVSECEEDHGQAVRKGKKRSLDDEDKTSPKKPKTMHPEAKSSKSPPKRSLKVVSLTSEKASPKRATAVLGSPPRPAVLDKKEPKEKHRSSLAEKKAKIVKRKVGKGVKERLLGKKVAQS